MNKPRRYSLVNIVRYRELTLKQAGGYVGHTGPKGAWHEILDHGDPSYGYGQERCVFRVPWVDGEDLTSNGNHPEIEREYERLLAESGWTPPPDDAPSPLNAVEICTPDEEQSQSQPCAYGNLVEHHAVYCHNEHWLYAPRKCRRTWYTGGEVRDEDCPGYKPNPRYTAKQSTPPTPGARASESAHEAPERQSP